jgi:hypothetical protein
MTSQQTAVLVQRRPRHLQRQREQVAGRLAISPSANGLPPDALFTRWSHVSARKRPCAL